MKKVMLVVALSVLFCLSACVSSAELEPKSGDVEESAFKTVESRTTSEPETTFDDANVLSFQLTNRDDNSFEEVIATFTVSNSSANPITYFSADFAYYDADGNIISDDGRFNNFGVPAGKTALMYTYSSIDGNYAKDDVADIKVTSYDYILSGKRYDVDLENKTVRVSTHDANEDADFESTNIFTFEYDDKGVTTIGSYKVGVRATNVSNRTVTYISFDMAFLDKDGNYLDSDGRYNDKSILSGNSVQIDSFLTRTELSSNVGSYGVYSYKYRLAEDDENGFNQYEVNLQTKEVIATHVD